MSDGRNHGLSNLLRFAVGALGMILSLGGLLWSRRPGAKRRGVTACFFAVTFALSAWIFFTGSRNYAVNMFGKTRMPTSFVTENGETIPQIIVRTKIPFVVVRDRSELKEILEEKGKFLLWLPCEKGGAWWKPSAFLFTRWTLPSSDVVCPDGRALIEYSKGKS